jgi:predicted RNA-binding protein with PIN domain
MPRHLIIDGYNLLGAATRSRPGVKPWSQAAREDLIHRLNVYRQRKGYAITVIFDGWRAGGSEQRHYQAGIEVIYSRRGEEADQVIRRLASEFGSECAVVSSDGEVGRWARAVGALVILAQEFWMKLFEVAARPASAPFKELESESEAKERRGPDKKGNPRKLPKSVRNRRRQLRGF